VGQRQGYQSFTPSLLLPSLVSHSHKIVLEEEKGDISSAELYFILYLRARPRSDFSPQILRSQVSCRYPHQTSKNLPSSAIKGYKSFRSIIGNQPVIIRSRKRSKSKFQNAAQGVSLFPIAFPFPAIPCTPSPNVIDRNRHALPCTVVPSRIEANSIQILITFVATEPF
jgi:hypothetical protein